MDDQAMLVERVSTLLLDLKKAQDALAVYTPRASAVSATWGALGNDLARRKAEILELLRAIRKEEEPAAQFWPRFGRAHVAVENTTREILALLQGGALRDAEEGGGVYALADALVKEVAAAAGRTWGGLTVPGERESIGTRSGLIRLTFPQVSIWDVPIVLHEYGHHVAPLIQNDLGQRPFELMCAAARTEVERAHLTELFADAFAAYTSGPALACTMVLLRLDPSTREATEDLPTHPSHDRRVQLVLRVLREQREEVDDARWDSLVEELERAWQSSMMESGEEPERGTASDRGRGGENEGAADGAAPPEEGLFRKLNGILTLLQNARYRSWTGALSLVDDLGADGGARGIAARGATIRDVLNAAWLARLEWPDRLFKVGERAERLIRAISNGRP